jgi:hypothetical protein
MPPEGMPPEGAPPEQALPPEEMGEDIQNASPEEQAAADEFVLKAWELIYDDRIFPQVVELLSGGGKEGGNPVEGLAMATEMVVTRVMGLANDAGAELNPIAVYNAAGDVLEELAEVSRRGKIKDYSEDPDALEAAWFKALDMFRENMEGRGEIDKASANAGLDGLKQANQDGKLERVMRKLADDDMSGQAGGDVPQEKPPAGRRPKGFASAMGV